MPRLLLGTIITGLFLMPGLAAALPIVGAASVVEGDTIKIRGAHGRSWHLVGPGRNSLVLAG